MGHRGVISFWISLKALNPNPLALNPNPYPHEIYVASEKLVMVIQRSPYL